LNEFQQHFILVEHGKDTTVKQSLYAVLKEKVPKSETLQTLLVEIEFRPLTYVSIDPHASESITSNHILLVKKNTVMSLGRFHADEEY
jgi:hypothetical protein